MVSPLLVVSRGANQILPQRTRLLTPLYNTRALGQQDHLEETKKITNNQKSTSAPFNSNLLSLYCLYHILSLPCIKSSLGMNSCLYICADTEPPLAGGGLLLEQSVDQHKHLLHDCILT